MTLVNIDLRNQGYETGPDDRVIFYSLLVREGDFGTVSTAPVEVELVDGKATVDLAPGPVGVQILAGQVADTRVKIGEVPPTGPTTLNAVMMVTPAYTPALQAQFLKSIQDAQVQALDRIDGEVAVAIDTEVGDFKDMSVEALSRAKSAEVVAGVADSKAGDATSTASSAVSTANNAVTRVTALEAMGGLSPESPVDGQTANILLQPESLSRAALDQSYITKQKAPLILLDYATGDGTTDDTAGVQQAFDDAITQGRALYSPPGANYRVGPLTVSGGLTLEGSFTFSALTSIRQDYVIRQTATVDWSLATVRIIGEYMAQHGLIASNIGRTKYGELRVERCTTWGLKVLGSGNNNNVTVHRLHAGINGTQQTVKATITAKTSNVATSLIGYSTLSFSDDLVRGALDPNAVYHVMVAKNLETGKYWNLTGSVARYADLPALAPDGAVYFARYVGMVYIRSNGSWPAESEGIPTKYEALKIRLLTQGTMEVFNLVGGEVGEEVSVIIPSGGGVDWEPHGDNGVWSISNATFSSNRGVGMHHAALYGHSIQNPAFEGNSIGFLCSTQTHQMVFMKPYFEVNGIDYVSQVYVSGVIISPLMDTSKIQNVAGRVLGSGSENEDPRLTIIDRYSGGIKTPTAVFNPSSQTVTPGRIYAYQFSSNNRTINITIDNDDRSTSVSERTIFIHIGQPRTGRGNTFRFALQHDNGDTLDGGDAPVELVLVGPALVTISRVGTDWIYTLLHHTDPRTSISIAPDWVGQTAVVGGVGYMSVGTGSVSDWKQITA